MAVGLLSFGLITLKKNISSDFWFGLIAIGFSVIVISLMTISSIIDYVDMNGLGVNSRFVVLLLVTLLMTFMAITIAFRAYADTKALEILQKGG